MSVSPGQLLTSSAKRSGQFPEHTRRYLQTQTLQVFRDIGTVVPASDYIGKVAHLTE